MGGTAHLIPIGGTHLDIDRCPDASAFLTEMLISLANLFVLTVLAGQLS